jgi:hypothetical protein
MERVRRDCVQVRVGHARVKETPSTAAVCEEVRSRYLCGGFIEVSRIHRVYLMLRLANRASDEVQDTLLLIKRGHFAM